MFWWWWSLQAQAACEVSQTTNESGVVVVVRVTGRPEGCRMVHLYPSDSLRISGSWYTPAGSRYRLPKNQLALLEGGSWEIVAPQLEDGGKLELLVDFPQGLSEKPTLTIATGAASPSPITAVERLDQVWNLHVNPKHPGWSFADPTQGFTQVDATWTLLPGAAPELLPIPANATIEKLEGGTAIPGAIRSGADTVHVVYTVPGTPAQGDRVVPPGSFRLEGPSLETEPVPDSSDSRRIRWLVRSVSGVGVIPNLPTFVAGLLERFRVRSLPEPAVPMALRGMEDRDALRQELYRRVREMPTLSLPGEAPLQPAQLNGVWQRGWGSAVEKGLILHRLLGQERFERTWVLTGVDADPNTLTGYDTVLLATAKGWLDPSCIACAAGEISSRFLGKPSISEKGEASVIPALYGKLSRKITLQNDTFLVEIQAEGEAAVWIREAIAELDPPQQPGRLLRLLGAPRGSITGGKDLDKRGHPLSLTFTSPDPPVDPWRDGAPWSELH